MDNIDDNDRFRAVRNVHASSSGAPAAPKLTLPPIADRAQTSSSPAEAPKPKHIVKKVKKEDFPDKPQYRGNEIIPATIENLEVILEKEGFNIRFNVIKKKVEIIAPDPEVTPDNRDNVNLTKVISLAARYGIATGHIPAFVEAIAARNPYNPVADWIKSRRWDGTDRLTALFDTVVTTPGYSKAFKEMLLRKWLLSAVAAAFMVSAFRCRGVLTLQGRQGINKTNWIRMLVSDPVLRELLVKIDHHLDVANKDSVLGAITHWIVEIGELDSSFKKDVARLKGFLTSTSDKVRRPYAKVESEYPRRTVFAATVNDARFLVDPTGNSRFWTIPVVKLVADHGIDMQQVFAQLALDFEAGAQWWLTPEEEAELEQINSRHQSISAVQELILGHVHHDLMGRRDNPYMTPTGLLRLLGISNPSNSQAKEAAAVLRQHLGEPKRVKGTYQWRFPGRIETDHKRSWLTPPAPPSDDGLQPPKLTRRPTSDDSRK